MDGDEMLRLALYELVQEVVSENGSIENEIERVKRMVEDYLRDEYQFQVDKEDPEPSDADEYVTYLDGSICECDVCGRGIRLDDVMEPYPYSGRAHAACIAQD